MNGIRIDGILEMSGIATLLYKLFLWPERDFIVGQEIQKKRRSC